MSWPVQVVDVTGSTNADLAAAAASGQDGPLVLAAREQTAGRGRLDRSWRSPPQVSLSVSVLFRPTVEAAGWTWVPMVVGLGVVAALARLDVAAALKWPNDVVVATAGDLGPGGAGPPVTGATSGLAKIAGILVAAVPTPRGPALVAGVGVNLRRAAAGGLTTATSLEQQRGPAGPVGFEEALAVVAAALEDGLLAWQADDGDPDRSGLRADYRRCCTTLGRDVVVDTPGGAVRGRAVDVDDDGALVLQLADGLARVSAGDVTHVR